MVTTTTTTTTSTTTITTKVLLPLFFTTIIIIIFIIISPELKKQESFSDQNLPGVCLYVNLYVFLSGTRVLHFHLLQKSWNMFNHIWPRTSFRKGD